MSCSKVYSMDVPLYILTVKQLPYTYYVHYVRVVWGCDSNVYLYTSPHTYIMDICINYSHSIADTVDLVMESIY